MNKRMVAVVGMSGALVLGMIAFSSVSVAEESAKTEVFKPVATVSGLMSGQGMMFKRLQKAVTDKETPRRLATIEVLSQVLAELSNVNQYHETKADYQVWARELRDTALVLSAEARKDDKADDGTMKKLVRSIKSTCGDCHDAYQD